MNNLCKILTFFTLLKLVANDDDKAVLQETNGYGLLTQEYMGCWKEDLTDRAMQIKVDRFPMNSEEKGSIQDCITSCRKEENDNPEKYISFAGLLNGTECWCGDETFQRHGPSADCYNGKACLETGEGICGNVHALSVYNIMAMDACDCGGGNTTLCTSNGTCLPSCRPGFTGPYCNTACTQGTYGINCKASCIENCVQGACDPVLGYCLVGCKNSHNRGPWCLSECAAESTTNKMGECPVCGHCWESMCRGADRSDTCIYGCSSVWKGWICEACNTGRWGAVCEKKCAAECFTCDMETGDCITCHPEHYGLQCELLCTQCPDGRCYKWSGECVEQHAPGVYAIPFSLQRLELKPCTQDCAFCDNETNTCLKCKDGKYGPNCENACSEYCLDGVCSRESAHCQECVLKRFGAQCQYNCPKNCLNDTCIQSHEEGGKCKYGCTPGHWGSYCEKKCSLNCLFAECHTTTGACITCPVGHFGDNCEVCPHGCSDWRCIEVDGNWTCETQPCNNVSGVCTNGCEPGAHGELCQFDCPPKCAAVLCEQSSGNCVYGCDDGFKGEQCRIEVREALDTVAIGTTESIVFNSVVCVGIFVTVVVVALLYNKRKRSLGNVVVDRLPGSYQDSDQMPLHQWM